MIHLIRAVAGAARRVWQGDLHLSDLAMQSEHRVARIRVLLIGVLTLSGLLVIAVEPGHDEYTRAVPVNLVCLAIALVVLFATRRGERPAWLALATAIGDVSLVSLLHLFDLIQGHPSVAVNGRVTFMAYFLALVGTCIRWDRRVALVAGAVAAVEYGAIVVGAARAWPATPTADVLQYGAFDWGVQAERVVTLLVFAVMCAGIAQWAVRLRDHATTDQLTGLMNRRSFEDRVRDELLRADRRKAPLTMVMLDVDHFKQVNDQHGHHAGDLVLRELARVLRDALRRTDLVTRWGGEEFAIAYLDTPGSDAASQVDRLRERVTPAGLVLPNGHRVGLTFSAGVASAPRDGGDLETLARAADARLLAAKRAGRNRVVGAEPSVVAEPPDALRHILPRG